MTDTEFGAIAFGGAALVVLAIEEGAGVSHTTIDAMLTVTGMLLFYAVPVAIRYLRRRP